MINSVVIHKDDSVVVSTQKIPKGQMVRFKKLDGKMGSFKALDDIPIYHKVAVRDIKKNEPILKYGEHIGLALKHIKKGEHVHEHNVESVREDLHV